MLISTAHKKIVLNLKQPGRVTTVIPSAKEFMYKGSNLVAVPHTLASTRALHALGIKAPSPIKHYYSWPGQYKPFYAQLETAAFLTLNDRAFVLNDMGCGKTLSALWAFDYLRSLGLAKKMLIVSPLSTLERTWADEVFRHFSHLNVAVLHGTKSRRLKMLDEDVDIYLINHDGLETVEKELIAKTEIDTLLVDEVASFRNAATKRWKCLNRIAKGRERLWGMTGTPTPNLPTDAWAQCKLISPERVPQYFGRFKEQVLKQVTQFKWMPREGATDVVYEAMQPSIRFTRDDCVDLPECQYVNRAVTMTAEQGAMYKTMAASLAAEYDTQKISAVNDAVKIQKLMQIACGVVYDTDGADVVIPNDPRIAVIKEIIEESGTKTIVFVPFRGVLRHVATQLGEDYEVACISGETPKGQRDEIFSAFQNPRNKLRVLVAQPAAMSHGLTLTAASTIAWYAPINSAETYVQANARITRPGQKHSQLIVNVGATPLEWLVYKRLKDKQNMQGLLLDMAHAAA